MFNKIFYISILLLSACSVGPDFKPPVFESPKSFYTKLAKEIKVNPDSNYVWWQYFNDPIMQKLVEEALLNNQDIKIAVERVNEARALSGEAFSAYFPDIDLDASYVEGLFGTAKNPFFENRARDYSAYRVGASATWEIDIFGRVRRLNEAKNATQASIEANLIDVILAIQADLAKAYITLRSLQGEEKVVHENSLAQKEVLKIVQSMYESGASSAFDLARAKSLYYQTRAELPKLHALKEATLNQIAVLLGKTVGQLPKEMRKTSPIPWYLGPVTISNPETALKMRPDIAMAEHELASANANIGIEISEYFPKLNLIGDLVLEAKRFADLDATGADVRSYGPAITWNILNFNRINKRVRAADARTKQALHKYQKTVLQALADIEGSLARFRTERMRFMLTRSAFTAGKQAAMIARDQYSVGALPLLDVITAEQSKLELERWLKQMEGTLQISYVDLFHSFGRGYVVEEKK